MKNKYWINLHYATKLDKTITVETLKKIVQAIIVCILHIVITSIIFASLSSCSTTKSSHWNSYAKCGAYGNP